MSSSISKIAKKGISMCYIDKTIMKTYFGGCGGQSGEIQARMQKP
jgi:hypothetical protein